MASQRSSRNPALPGYDSRLRKTDLQRGINDGSRHQPSVSYVEDLVVNRSANPVMLSPYVTILLAEGYEQVAGVRKRFDAAVESQRRRQDGIAKQIVQAEANVVRAQDELRQRSQPVASVQLHPQNGYEQRRPDIIRPRREWRRARRIAQQEAVVRARMEAVDALRSDHHAIDIEIERMRSRFSDDARRERDLTEQRVRVYWEGVNRVHENRAVLGPLLEGWDLDMPMPDWVMPDTYEPADQPATT
jgi:hypothetical protein